MRKTLGLVSALALVAGLAASAIGPHGTAGQKFSAFGSAVAATVFKQQAINATTGNYMVIAPTFYTTNSQTPHSYFRFFNGAGTAGSTATSTFRITLVGDKTGTQYGSSFNIAVPHMASIQKGIHDLTASAGVTLGSLTGGDTGYVVYVSNSDSEAGVMHAVFDWGSHLFENMSMCNTNINQQMVSLHNELVLLNMHTSVGPSTTGVSYPSTMRIHNYYNVPITYTLTFFNGDTGTQICQLSGNTVQPNTTLTIPMTTVEANAACAAGVTSTNYLNVTIADQSGGQPNAIASHTIFVADQHGSTSMTPTCAVNPVDTSGGGGVIISPYT